MPIELATLFEDKSQVNHADGSKLVGHLPSYIIFCLDIWGAVLFEAFPQVLHLYQSRGGTLRFFDIGIES